MHIIIFFFIYFYFLNLCKRNSALSHTLLCFWPRVFWLTEFEESYKQMKSIFWLWNFWHILALSGCQSEQLDIQLMSLHRFELSITLFWVLVNTFLKVCGMLLLKFYLYYPGSCFCNLSSLRSRNISLYFHFYLHLDILGFLRWEKAANWVLGIGFFLSVYMNLNIQKKEQFLLLHA